MTEYIWLNGRYLQTHEATISVLDRGLLYGDGLFETLRTYGGEPFKLSDHLERLKSSAHQLKIPLHVSAKSFQSIIEKLLRLNNLSDAYVRITLTRGRKESGFYLSSSDNSSVIIQVSQLPDYHEYAEPGVKVIISPWLRSPNAPLGGHKTLNYLENLLARAEALEHKAFESIIFNTHQHLCEGSMSNIFIVKKPVPSKAGGEIFTPALTANILPGITRKVILGLCPGQHLKIHEANLTKQQLLMADEIFLTNSLIEIVPVVECLPPSPAVGGTRTGQAGKKIGTGQPGKITRQLQLAYQELVQKEPG
ncbi:MAG: aminotransferase class IV [Planctomycetota bacterium]